MLALHRKNFYKAVNCTSLAAIFLLNPGSAMDFPSQDMPILGHQKLHIIPKTLHGRLLKARPEDVLRYGKHSHLYKSILNHAIASQRTTPAKLLRTLSMMPPYKRKEAINPQVLLCAAIEKEKIAKKSQAILENLTRLHHEHGKVKKDVTKFLGRYARQRHMPFESFRNFFDTLITTQGGYRRLLSLASLARYIKPQQMLAYLNLIMPLQNFLIAPLEAGGIATRESIGAFQALLKRFQYRGEKEGFYMHCLTSRTYSACNASLASIEEKDIQYAINAYLPLVRETGYTRAWLKENIVQLVVFLQPLAYELYSVKETIGKEKQKLFQRKEVEYCINIKKMIEMSEQWNTVRLKSSPDSTINTYRDGIDVYHFLKTFFVYKPTSVYEKNVAELFTCFAKNIKKEAPFWDAFWNKKTYDEDDGDSFSSRSGSRGYVSDSEEGSNGNSEEDSNSDKGIGLALELDEYTIAHRLHALLLLATVVPKEAMQRYFSLVIQLQSFLIRPLEEEKKLTLGHSVALEAVLDIFIKGGCTTEAMGHDALFYQAGNKIVGCPFNSSGIFIEQMQQVIDLYGPYYPKADFKKDIRTILTSMTSLEKESMGSLTIMCNKTQKRKILFSQDELEEMESALEEAKAFKEDNRNMLKFEVESEEDEAESEEDEAESGEDDFFI